MSLKQIDEQFFRKSLYLKLSVDRDWKSLDLNEHKVLLIDALKNLGYSLNKQALDICNIKYKISNKCRYCNKQVEEDSIIETQSYWQPLGFPFIHVSHKDCKAEGYKEEAKACQEIDSDCNDCKHFKRDKGNSGICLKTGLEVKAAVNHSTLHSCFEHRRSN